MSGYAVDTGALSGLIDRMAAWSARAEELGDELEWAVRRLHGQWKGDAADAHLAAHQRWHANEAELRAAADRLRAVVAVAHGNYTAAVAANRQMWD